MEKLLGIKEEKFEKFYQTKAFVTRLEEALDESAYDFGKVKNILQREFPGLSLED